MAIDMILHCFHTQLVMPPRRGRRTAIPSGNLDGAGGPALGHEVLGRLVESLSVTAQPSFSVEQARRLGATGFVGATNPEGASVWLSELEKVLDEEMQCSDAKKLRIAEFLLSGKARSWWSLERSVRVHSWESFKAAFDAFFRSEALEVERQRTMRGSRRRSLEGSSSGSQGSSKRGSFSSGSWSGGHFRGSRFAPSSPPSQGAQSRQSFQQTEEGSSSFSRGPRPGRGRRMLCGTCNRFHEGSCLGGSSCFHCGQFGHFKRECPFLFPGSAETSGSSFSASGSGFRPQQPGSFRPQGSQFSQGSGSSSRGQSSSAARGGGRRGRRKSCASQPSFCFPSH